VFFNEGSFGSKRLLQIYFRCNFYNVARTGFIGLLDDHGRIAFMPPSEKTPFCKYEDCPASGELLEFQRGKLGDARCGEIQAHLEACEFCDAETEFYSQYPQDDAACETCENVEIPAPLYELAEALLKNRQADSSSLDALMQGKRGLAIKKA
jgi:hypothetical protein